MRLCQQPAGLNGEIERATEHGQLAIDVGIRNLCLLTRSDELTS